MLPSRDWPGLLHPVTSPFIAWFVSNEAFPVYCSYWLSSRVGNDAIGSGAITCEVASYACLPNRPCPGGALWKGVVIDHSFVYLFTFWVAAIYRGSGNKSQPPKFRRSSFYVSDMEYVPIISKMSAQTSHGDENLATIDPEDCVPNKSP